VAVGRTYLLPPLSSEPAIQRLNPPRARAGPRATISAKLAARAAAFTYTRLTAPLGLNGS
jgi:hypothetical protein